MSFLENLKSILNIENDLSKLKDLRIHFFSGNKKIELFKFEKTIHNTTLNININGATEEIKPKLLQAIKEAVEVENNLLIETTANNLLKAISEEEDKEESKNLLNFFKGKIKNSDLEILRAALFVKNEYDQNKPIGDLKHDVILKHGDRGRNIVNLCSAGYFTSIIKPLYEAMVQDTTFTPELFLITFDKIVDRAPFAIFVSSQMTSQQLLQEVEMQMTINKKYGIDYLNIHAIGEHNVLKIEEVFVKLKNKFTHNPDIESGRKYIIVTIYF